MNGDNAQDLAVVNGLGTNGRVSVATPTSDGSVGVAVLLNNTPL